MTLTPELLIAINVLFTGIILGSVQIYNSRRTARKDDLEWLRGEVARLNLRLENQDKEIDGLRLENSTLHRQMIQLMDENEQLRNRNVELQNQIDELRKNQVASK
jgi:predicted nuclease with TOPRIM domain